MDSFMKAVFGIFSTPYRRLQNWHRLRAHRLKVEAEREKMQAYFAGLEAERREQAREQKARDKYTTAGLTKMDRTLREKWIRRWDGKRI